MKKNDKLAQSRGWERGGNHTEVEVSVDLTEKRGLMERRQPLVFLPRHSQGLCL